MCVFFCAVGKGLFKTLALNYSGSFCTFGDFLGCSVSSRRAHLFRDLEVYSPFVLRFSENALRLLRFVPTSEMTKRHKTLNGCQIHSLLIATNNFALFWVKLQFGGGCSNRTVLTHTCSLITLESWNIQNKRKCNSSKCLQNSD